MTLLKIENLTTSFEPTDYSDVISKFYFDEKLKETDAPTSYIQKRLQRIQITIQQTICRKNFNSKSCENYYSITLS